MRKIFSLLVLSLLVAGRAWSATGGWWNEEWNFRKELTLDTSIAGANIGASIADAPVLIRLHAGNFGYFGDTKPDGSDLRFIAADDKTPLKFHVERYDPTNQLAFIWVHVPQLAGGSNAQKLYLYYGNPKAPAASDAAGTYDKNQVLVYHFGESALPPVDSTAYANKSASANVELAPASFIGGGAKFSGDQSISVPSSPALRLIPAQGATLSAWVRADGVQSDAYVLALQQQGNELVLGINGSKAFARLVAPATRAEAQQSNGEVAAGEWHHLAATVTADALTLYVDGNPAGTASAHPGEISGPLTLGAGMDGNHRFKGELDEVQFENLARSAEWMQAAVRSQGQQANLVAYGNDAQREGQKVSYFKTTLQNVTPDGWVVIIVLAVMFVISILLMISKAIYLFQVRKANAGFLKEFEQLRNDYTALDQPEAEDGDEALDESPFMPHMHGGEDKHRMSTIYRLYHHGVQEMTGRVGLQSAGARAVKTLTPQTMAAIRATMEASSVRLTQKLTSKMVLLTIAISGGPFLGLLGTVVGVMITFAAIAASGDVNVNSIAPGIAAALVATVAGLGVAIPALFGYNWLNTQIKEISADMRVFIDEFVTRVAEHYS